MLLAQFAFKEKTAVTKSFVNSAAATKPFVNVGVSQSRDPPSEYESMAAKPEKRTPTPAELAILTVIWEYGPATVREVFARIGETQDVGYTTTLKLMQIMTEKGLLQCDTSVRPQVYRASRPRQQTQRKLLVDLLDRAFGGSPGNLVLTALSLRKASPQELREIRRLLDEQEGTKS